MSRSSLLVSPAVLFFLWMLSLSLKNELDNTAYPPVFIPNPPTLANFVDVFEKNDFLHLHDQLGDRVVLAPPASRCCSACRPATASPRRRRTKAAVLILIARVTPGLSYLIPLFLLFQWLGHDRHADAAGDHPSGDHRADRGLGDDRLLRGPAGRARGGGAGRWRDHLAGLPHVAMPLARPGIMVAMILAFIFSLEQLHLRRGAGRARRRARCRSRSTTC